jgi:hypothetical protein
MPSNKSRLTRRYGQDEETADRKVPLVQPAPDLRDKLAASTIPAHNKLYQRQIEPTDAEIDALVHELYGLTEEETAIVEGRADKCSNDRASGCQEGRTSYCRPV